MDSERLTNEEISRYSRQLLLPEIGVIGQSNLKKAKVLIVGGGGLGCPVAIYLAGAGVGCLGIVDYDSVEVNNLHRQVLHKESAVGTPKSRSISLAVKDLNSSVECREHVTLLDPSNALSIVSQYDVVADCTDNVATRYLLNDACVLANRPLVSGSALKWDGQLTVYHQGSGPCFRCIFPRPPPPETVTNCSDGGVVGPVVGVIGSMQALEIIKIITGAGCTYSGRLLVFDGLDGRLRTVTLRGRQRDCSICGENPTITQLQDYVQFCGAGPCDKVCSVQLLNREDRVSAEELRALREKTSQLILDVRPTQEFSICHLPNSLNVPLDSLEKNEHLSEQLRDFQRNGYGEVVVVCHRGNDSQKAVELLKKLFLEESAQLRFRDLIGGLESWAESMDPSFPRY